MTLQEAKENIGGLVRLQMVPLPGAAPDKKPYDVYMQIIEVRDGYVEFLVEDLRGKPHYRDKPITTNGGPCGTLFSSTPGDAYFQYLHIVEAPRSRRARV